MIVGSGIILGAIGGLLYWSQIGCNPHHCAIASNPVVASSYGALLLGITADTIAKYFKIEENES